MLQRPPLSGLKALSAGLVLGGLVACSAAVETPQRVNAPPVRPMVKPVAEVPKASAASMAAQAYYAQVQQSLLSEGLLRTDGGGADTPFTDRMLAENFLRVALYDEYARSSGSFVRQETASQLRKWQGPIRFGLRFGASVPQAKQASDRAKIGSYLARISQITGHPISLSDAAPNYWLYIVNEEERKALGPAINAAIPGLSPADVRGITDMPQSTYCLVYAMTDGGSAVYSRAFAVIRAEHPDLLRLSCIHEELAQGMGLANDSPRARPSIFNDDEEFALLTTQDEYMLRILYDPQLRPGMTEAEARPIVFSLASRLLGGES